MAALSESEIAYIAQGMEQGLRSDGRGCSDYRPLEFELGLVPQASGSARLHLGTTDVIVGVKAELGTPDADAPDCGSVRVTVECSPTASPEFEVQPPVQLATQGRGGEAWGTSLGRALEASLQGTPASGSGLDLRALCVIAGRSCWVLYVDGVVLNDGGNVLDALSLAARAALESARIPKVGVTAGEGSDDEPEIEVDDDPEAQQALDTSRVPVVVTVSQVGTRCVVDLRSQEEPCARASLHVAVARGGRVCGATKAGSQGVNPSMMQDMLETAQRIGSNLITQLDGYVPAAVAALTGV